MSPTSPSAWKLDLNSTWSKENAAAFLKSIGIEFTTAFLDPLNRSTVEHNPYQKWFLLNGEIRHHILSNAPLDNEDGIWQPEPTDTDHPKIVLNTKWHYRNSRDLSPSLI